MRRHHARFSVLFPMIAGLVACGGSVTTIGGDTSGTSSSGGGSSGSSGNTSSGGSSGASSGGTSTSSSGGVSGVFDVDLCTAGPNGVAIYDALNGVTPASAVDYMELRDEYQFQGDPNPQKPTVLSKSGTPCATASDKPACQTSLSEARSNGWKVENIGMMPPTERYLVATNGNNLEFATSEPDLVAFVAPVDNPHDAALLVTATGKHRIVCGTPNARKTATGWEIKTQTGTDCGTGTKIEEVVVAVTTSGSQYATSTTLVKEGDPNCVFGRKPAGLCAKSEGSAHDAVGRFFAEAAFLEAASVFSFERLEDELRALGAPAEMIECARTSREDEIRHARMTSSLAKRFGATVAEPDIDPWVAEKQRTAFEIALENAVEGCVRESYAAVVAHWQARACTDRRIAAVMSSIAADETKHAALAWDVAAWLEPQLTDEERAKIDAAREAARDEMRASLARELDRDVVAIAGMPRAHEATALFEALCAAA